MRPWLPIFLLSMVVFATGGTRAGEQDDVRVLVAEAREIVNDLHARLKTKLQLALKKEGTVKALEACHLDVPDMVRAAGRNGWEVRRTSVKVRNLEDAPDKWEYKVLEELDAKNNADVPEEQLEHWEIVQKNGHKRFRYMKGIVALQVCTRCHGKHIKKEIISQLDSLYPFDQARGYEAGDLRGAYSLSLDLTP